MPWLPELLAGLAGILYFVQIVSFARYERSVLDEGNYIYKGWLFVTGQYIPYQDYGPWTNHAPLSFLIFGVVQLLFGPGLRTVRYFSVFVGCLFLLGMWLAAKRIAGRWIAALVILALALNTVQINIYSAAVTQVIVACMLAWILYLVSGEGRSLKELFAGAVLVAALILTRENFVLILPFVFIYVFWQHGKKAGFIVFSTTILIVLAVHIVYWPGIMKIWAQWLPQVLLSFVPPTWLFQGGGEKIDLVESSFPANLAMFFRSVQLNFLAVFGALAVLLAWPKGGLKRPAQFRIVIFLSAMFVFLYLVHGWAAFGKGYCPYCIINYVAFFFPIGLLLFVAFLPGITDRRPIFPAWLTGGLILLMCVGIGYSTYDIFGPSLASIKVPRISNFSFQPGTVELQFALANKFNLSHEFLISALPSGIGFLAGVLLLVVGYIITRLVAKTSLLSNTVYALIFITMLTGFVLSPTPILGRMDVDTGCDAFAQYEQVGAELAQRIPPGSQVYWNGGRSPVPLLYLPDIKIYPPQLNANHSFVRGGDTQKILMYGFWNEELDNKWFSEADIILVRDYEYMSMKASFSPDIFTELGQTSPTFPCNSKTSIHIFKRK